MSARRKQYLATGVMPQQLFPGIVVRVDDGNLTAGMPALATEGDCLRISYCRSGHISWDITDGYRIDLYPGNFALSASSAWLAAAPVFPSPAYSGLLLQIQWETALCAPPEILRDTSVLADLHHRFGSEKDVSVFPGRKETDAIFDGFFGHSPNLAQAYLQLKAMELLLYLSGATVPHQDHAPHRLEQIEMVRQIHDQLLHHMDHRITIEELARQYHVNPTTLKTVFKDVYGTSLAAHIKEHRLEHAAELLCTTEMPVGDIAHAVGYDSQSRFAAAFKDTYGCAPKEYRAQQSGFPDRDHPLP